MEAVSQSLVAWADFTSYIFLWSFLPSQYNPHSGTIHWDSIWAKLFYIGDLLVAMCSPTVTVNEVQLSTMGSWDASHGTSSPTFHPFLIDALKILPITTLLTSQPFDLISRDGNTLKILKGMRETLGIRHCKRCGPTLGHYHVSRPQSVTASPIILKATS